MDKYEKLTQLMADEAFVEELLAIEGAEKVQKFLIEKGIELTIEEIIAWGDAIRAADSGDELNEDALDNIAGGVIRFPWLPLPRPIPIFPPKFPKGWPKWW